MWHRERQTDREIERYRQTGRQTETDRGIQKQRQTDKDRQVDRTDGQRQAGRQAARQTGK